MVRFVLLKVTVRFLYGSYGLVANSRVSTKCLNFSAVQICYYFEVLKYSLDGNQGYLGLLLFYLIANSINCLIQTVQTVLLHKISFVSGIFFSGFYTDEPDITTQAQENTENAPTVTDMEPRSNDPDTTEETRKLIIVS